MLLVAGKILPANVFLYLNDKFQHFEDVAKIHSSDNKIDSQSLAVTIVTIQVQVRVSPSQESKSSSSLSPSQESKFKV